MNSYLPNLSAEDTFRLDLSQEEFDDYIEDQVDYLDFNENNLRGNKMKVHLSRQCVIKNETQRNELNEQIGKIITEMRDIWTECQNMFFCDPDGNLETRIAQCFVFFLKEQEGRKKLNDTLRELNKHKRKHL